MSETTEITEPKKRRGRPPTRTGPAKRPAFADTGVRLGDDRKRWLKEHYASQQEGVLDLVDAAMAKRAIAQSNAQELMPLADIKFPIDAMGWKPWGHHQDGPCFIRDEQYLVLGNGYFDLKQVCGEFVVLITVYKVNDIAIASIKLDAAVAKLIAEEMAAEDCDDDDGFRDPRAKYDDLRSFDAQWTPDDLDGFAAQTVEECPCGCGLKNDVCAEQLARVKAHNDALPF